MSVSKSLYQRRAEVVPNALGIFNPSTVVSAKGAMMIDADGRELIDFAGGIGVLNAGHCPEPVVKAIQKQAEKLIHSCFNVALYEEYLQLAEKLASLFPHGEKTKVMLTNSGAEAVENAIKFARQATGKSGILCYSGSFHGRTMMAMTLTSNVKYKMGCGPYAPEVYRLDFPYYSPKAQKESSEDDFVAAHIKKFKQSLSAQLPVSQMAAIIIELVQGEGGFSVVSKQYLAFLRQFCTENNVMLIIDEVQSGFGRTGAWNAGSHYGITADITTFAKSMGSGMPIGAVVGRADVLDKASPSTVGGTYLGNPLACAASLATIEYMEAQNINEKGKHVGKKVKATFDRLQADFSQKIADVRGLGAMLAMELVKENGEPDGDFVRALMNKCLEKGLVIISAGTYGNCVRVLSPLIIEDAVLDKGLAILEASFRELVAP